jgi:hypothetical protein
MGLMPTLGGIVSIQNLLRQRGCPMPLLVMNIIDEPYRTDVRTQIAKYGLDHPVINFAVTDGNGNYLLIVQVRRVDEQAVDEDSDEFMIQTRGVYLFSIEHLQILWHLVLGKTIGQIRDS